MKKFPVLFVVIASMLCSCSSDDYLNAIPSDSVALLSVDVANATGEAKGVNATLLKSFFRVSDVSDCGIDLSSKIYLFESPDGTLGLASRVKSSSSVDKWLCRLSQKGLCQEPQKRRDLHFTILNNSWLVGFSDNALLVMGPVLPSTQSELLRKMTINLHSDEGVKDTPLFDRLESITSPVAIVSQAQALPSQLIAPFTIGAPADTDASQIFISAEIHADKGCLIMDGQTFSFDETVDKSLKQAGSAFRPLTSRFLPMIPHDALFTIAMNADGSTLLPLMRQSREFRTLLTGVGVDVDIDKFIEQVRGDLIITLPTYNDEHVEMRWAAQLDESRELLDPESEQHLMNTKMQPTSSSLPETVQSNLEGAHQAVLLNLHSLDSDKRQIANIFTSLLKPLFGDVDYILYRNK